MSVSEQARNFCLFFIIGLFIGFIFDLFRSFRRNFKMKNIFVDIQDIISGLIFFRSVILFSNGDIRFYIVFSTILGISIYFLTISETYVIITDVILRSIKFFIKKFIKLIKLFYCFIVKKVKKLKIKEKQFWKIFLNLKRFVELSL